MNPERERICRSFLYATTQSEYGALYQNHVLEQYKIYIGSIDYTSKLKHTTNNYFLGIHTLLLTAAGIALTKDGFFVGNAWHIVIPIVGAVLSGIWWHALRTHKMVNAAKFEILHCIESSLPLALYKTEWELLSAGKKNPHHGTKTEPFVPFLFIIIYLFIFFFVH
ncbi:MAG: hypothetical protein A2675_00705 [Candidatus Yonathbacteria bacterium RIFCSPHIGHO2_01_FULL_51_10]|uniref:Uncharacterized protein n=1 Tax=Candidatus Yonathbacteria bacterium RIFCSPHIGHO2_01_FULL_51_10 TaxID=1802723 RepID=A0A1G2S7S5_9BACT|nr:MAG: hypothetical protein A2675_00705 [Candidatus Yonathbacteria bacterium RIFCSPHIGHO2_01_FULL_51_10]